MVLNNSCINVGIADMKVSADSGNILRTVLGSCVGICLYDEERRVSGMAHIMLPVMKIQGRFTRYADTAIPLLIKEMIRWGASSASLTAKIAGGATMFNLTSQSAISHIGKENVLKVKDVLAKNHIPIHGEDTGGNYSRTINFYTATGEVRVRSSGRPDVLL